jgi:hypothetical protein
LHLPGNVLDEHDELSTAGQLRVGIVAEEDILRIHDSGCLELFLLPNFRITLAGAVRDH